MLELDEVTAAQEEISREEGPPPAPDAPAESPEVREIVDASTLTPMMKQYLEVLHDMKSSNNLIVLIPTEGGTPLLDLAALRRNLAKP